jgi:hypothetical protein
LCRFNALPPLGCAMPLLWMTIAVIDRKKRDLRQFVIARTASPGQSDGAKRDDAIQGGACCPWIASLRSQ